MRPIRILGLILGSVLVILGQLPATGLHVRGTVIDSTTRQPIANARVQMNGGQDALTSVNGTYDISVALPGSYDLKVEAQGYLPETKAYSFVLRGSTDTADVDMEMYRPGVITGRLIDAETKQPITTVKVSARRLTYRLGQIVMAGVPSAYIDPMTRLPIDIPQAGKIDETGVFRIEQLRPGSYSLLLPPEVPEQINNSSPRTPPPAAAATGYRRQSWPDRGDQSGLHVRPGDTLELGDISIAREPLFKISGVLTGCPATDDLSRGLLLNIGTMAGGPVTPVACGEPFTAENLSPGQYSFDVNIEGIGPVRAGAVNIVNRDVQFNPVFTIPQAITGSVIVPENFPKGTRWAISAASASVAPDGTFKFTLPRGEPVEIKLEPPPLAPYYVSEILYNGSPLRDGWFELNPYSGAQELKLRIAADGAHLGGTVRRSGELADSSVILVAWPVRLKNGFPVHYFTDAPYGEFSFPVVPPGNYRAIAVESRAWETELQKPGVLSGLASSGTQVDLTPNGAREVTLEVRWIQLSQ